MRDYSDPGAGSVIEELSCFIKKAVSPYHAMRAAAEELEAAGFSGLEMNRSWEISAGGRYYVVPGEKALFAFTVPKNIGEGEGFRIAAAHLDWPCMKVKPGAEAKQGPYISVNTETYGGPILNTWFDRPLSIAGQAAIREKETGRIRTELVDFKKPVMTLPNLAIHMNREVNKGVEINKQTDLKPLTDCADLIGMLAEKIQADREDILYYDLCVYNCEEPALTGFDDTFLSAPRLDNLTSVRAAISAIKTVNESDTAFRGISMIALFDHEEIGSKTREGAGSMLLPVILEKLVLSMGGSRLDYLNALSDSFMLSLDVGHALHPNHPEKADPANKCYLNQGLLIKTECNQRYITEAASIAFVEALCQEDEIPFQIFTNRSDLPGGSTLGAIASSFTLMRTVDVGVPLLAMHSAREMMGCRDQLALHDLVRAFLGR